MLLSQVVNKLLNQNGLTNASATKEASLSASNIRLKKIDCLDARLKNLCLSSEIFKERCWMVNWVVLNVIRNLSSVDRLTHDVPDAAQRRFAYWHHHWLAGVLNAKITLKTIG